MNQSDQWYILDQGVQYGPFTPDQMIDLVRESRLAPASLVWHDGLAAWMPASAVDGLFTDSLPTLSGPSSPYEAGRRVILAPPPSPGEDPLHILNPAGKLLRREVPVLVRFYAGLHIALFAIGIVLLFAWAVLSLLSTPPYGLFTSFVLFLVIVVVIVVKVLIIRAFLAMYSGYRLGMVVFMVIALLCGLSMAVRIATEPGESGGALTNIVLADVLIYLALYLPPVISGIANWKSFSPAPKRRKSIRRRKMRETRGAPE